MVEKLRELLGSWYTPQDAYHSFETFLSLRTLLWPLICRFLKISILAIAEYLHVSIKRPASNKRHSLEYALTLDLGLPNKRSPREYLNPDFW